MLNSFRHRHMRYISHLASCSSAWLKQSITHSKFQVPRSGLFLNRNSSTTTMIGRLRLMAGGSGLIRSLRGVHGNQQNGLARRAHEVLGPRQRGSLVRGISSGRSLWKEPDKTSPEEGAPRPSSTEATPDHVESPIITAGATAAAAAEAASKYSQQYTSAYVELEKNLMARIHESSSRRFRLALISTIVFIVWVVAVFGKMIRKALSDQTAGLAKETLENADLKVQTEELAMAVVRTVLNDTQVTANAATFLREAAMMPETQQALLKLTIHVLQHKESLQEVSGLVKRLLAQLSKDKEAVESLGAVFAASLQEPAVKTAAIALITDLCKDPEIMAAVTELTIAVINKDEVSQVRFSLLSSLFISLSHYAYSNANSKIHSPLPPSHPHTHSAQLTVHRDAVDGNIHQHFGRQRRGGAKSRLCRRSNGR